MGNTKLLDQHCAAEAEKASPMIAEAMTPELLCPNKADIAAHLYALFSPEFVRAHQGGWIEIAYAQPASDSGLNRARTFSAFDLEQAVNFAAEKNAAGFNVYVGAALRQGDKPLSGRANDDNFLAA